MADRLTLSLGGELAEAVRVAARAADVTPAAWVGAVVARAVAGEGGPATVADEPAASAVPPDQRRAPEPRAGEREGLDDPSAWEDVTDATGTFSVSLPRGWQNRAWVVPTPLMRYPMVVTTSPDGSTTLFSGDAELPLFVDPSAALFPTPGTVVRPPTPATDFLAEWVAYRHGRAPGFRVLGVAEDAQVAEVAAGGLGRGGAQPSWLTGARLEAEFSEDGRAVRAIFLAVTIGLGGSWFAQVHGVRAAGDPAAHLPALLRLVASTESTPAERQRMQAERLASQSQHLATMQSIDQNTAMMTAHHQQRMAGIQAAGLAHQQAMAERREGFDAGLQAWHSQQAAQDAQHSRAIAEGMGPTGGGDAQQDFVNLIREERTVLDADGQAHQMAAGADRYFHNEHTGAWVGLQEHQDIVQVTGADRDDFTEGTIQS